MDAVVKLVGESCAVLMCTSSEISRSLVNKWSSAPPKSMAMRSRQYHSMRNEDIDNLGVSKHKIVHILLGHNKYRFLCLTRPGNCSLHLSLPWDLICDLKGLVYIAWQLVIHPLAGDCPAGIEYKCTIMLENAANYSTTCMNATHLIGLPPSFPLTLDSWSTWVRTPRHQNFPEKNNV